MINDFMVTTRSGDLVPGDIKKIQKKTDSATFGIKGVSAQDLEAKLHIQFYNGITTKDIQTSIIKTSVDMIDIDTPNYTYVAAKAFLDEQYHVVGNLLNGVKGVPYSHSLKDYLDYGVTEGRINNSFYRDFDLDELNRYIVPERDFLFNYLGIKASYDRYLLKNRKKELFELPQHMFMGIAMFLAQNEKNKMFWAKKFYDTISMFEIMLATPTLSNARTNRNQLSSCFRKGTPVKTLDGFTSIDELKEGDFVLTHKNRFMEVEELYEREFNGSLIKLKIAGQTRLLEATEEHPILSIKKDDINCIRHLSNCLLSNGKNKNCFKLPGKYKNDCEYLNKEFTGISKWSSIKDLDVGDFVNISFSKYEHNIDLINIIDYINLKGVIEDEDGFLKMKRTVDSLRHRRSFLNVQTKPIKNNIALDYNLMLFLGYFLAEGHISKDRTSLTFTFGSKEKYYINEVLSITYMIFGYQGSIKENIDNSTSVIISNRLISEFIFELVGSGFNKKRLTNILKYAKPEAQKGLLVGCFRGDSSAVEYGYILAMANGGLINDLFEIALRNGYSPLAYKHKNIPKLGNHIVYNLVIGSARDESFCLLVNKNISKINFNAKLITAKEYFWHEGEFYSQIRDKSEEQINETVYNIEVEEDHSYSVNNVSVHNCFQGQAEDNIEGIFDSYKDMALLSKYGGGIGWDWARIRASNAPIDGHIGAGGGLIPWLKITNDIAIGVDQLGTRKGAIAVYIEPWHLDVKDFLDLKKNAGEERRRAHDLFPGLWINDLFMKRVEEDGIWTLFDPYDTSDLHELHGEDFEMRYCEYEFNSNIRKETLNAKDLWKKILLSYYETGSPFLGFKDEANRRNANSHDGIIGCTNLCVTGDTRLATQFGQVKAKELFEMNKKILATYDYRVNGDSKNYGAGVAECIVMHKTKENAEIFELTTKDGYSIKSTEWHEYYVSRNKSIIKIPLKDVLVGDKLMIQSDVGQFGIEGSYELGFISGLIAGDGTFSVKEKNGYSIAHIDLYNEDMNLGDKVFNCIETLIDKDYGFLQKAHKKDFKTIYPKVIQHTENSSKLRFSSGRLGRILDEKFNFNRDTKQTVPEFIFKGRKETVVGYLQGMFISDGTVNIIQNEGIPTFTIQLGSIHKNLLKDIQVLLSNFGIRSKIYDKGERNKNDRFTYTTVNGEFKTYESKNIFILQLNGNNAIKFINEIGFIGPKQEKALAVLQRRESMGYTRHSNKSEKFEVEITSIKKVGVEDVYDTTQLLNHSLIFNGLVTGNCTEIFQNTTANKYAILLELDGGKEFLVDEEVMIDVVLIDGTIESKVAKKLSNVDRILIDGNIEKIEFISHVITEKGETLVCNLGSVNLSKVNSKEDMARVVPIGIRMLDNVIDLNMYPIKQAYNANKKSRAIGLGVMGEAQMLAEKGIYFGSDIHLKEIDKVMEWFSFYSINASADLAVEKGAYPLFEGSKWSKGILPIDTANKNALLLVDRELDCDWDALREKVSNGMRNGYLMAIAPTSTISIVTGTTQAIEPIYRVKYYEENLSGLIPVVAPNISPDTISFYQNATAYNVDQLDIVRAGGVRQKWIDQGQSLNIFMRKDKASGQYLNNIYMLGWKLGLKATYYLRSESPEEIKTEVIDRGMECSGCQ